MSAPIYERGKELEKMLARPSDRATAGPSGIRKAPKRTKPGAKPGSAPIYPATSRPEFRKYQVETASRLPHDHMVGMLMGYRHDEQLAARAAAEAEAKELVTAVADKIEIQDDRAKDALEFAVSVIKNDLVSTKDRLAAARMTLEWTQPKPASKQELEIKKAEDYLEALAKEDDTGTA